MLLTVVTTLSLAGLGRFAPGVHEWAEHLAHSIDFQSLIMHGMLPLLLFAGAFLLDLEHLEQEKIPVAVVGGGGAPLSVFAVAGVMFVISGPRRSLVVWVI